MIQVNDIDLVGIPSVLCLGKIMSQIIMLHVTAEDAEVSLPRDIESVKSVASILGYYIIGRDR